jgi:ribonucleoside-diphosphate reductase alpha chain
MTTISVVKRDGKKELLNLEKIHQCVFWACDGLSGVSASEVELRAQLQIDEGTTTTDIHETLIKSAAELISEDAPNYQYVASRLVNYQLRKEVYGRFEPSTVRHLVEQNVRLGVYSDDLLTKFNDNDWRKLEKIVKHQRDDLIAYAGIEQWRGKYLVKNRVTKKFYETPQIALLLIAAIGFKNYPEETRMTYIKDFYDAVSQFDISLPTPIMANLRTPENQLSSCVVLSVDDTLDSIGASSHAILRYISQAAGLGIDLSRIRAIGSEVAGGKKEHTGMLPFLRFMQSSVKAMSQGGLRGGSATVHVPFWHYEFEELVVLKNNKGTEFNRVRHIDYCFLFNRTMYQRLIDGGNISFFSPRDCPGLLEAFWSNPDEFDRLYVQYENTASIRRKTLTALDAFSKFMTERKETGRIYAMNIDHANSHGSFIPEVAPITQSNLCQEISLPSEPISDVNGADGVISLCTLAALNFGRVKTPADFKKPANLIVRFLDEILSSQNYPVNAAKLATEAYRPLGVGIINLAYFLAKNGLKYDSGALPLVDEYMEAFSYYLIEASIELAKEKGPCEKYMNTRYAQGIMPVDTRKLAVDELLPNVERMDWQRLRDMAKQYGIRNATLMALMPAETSAQISNSTNGIEPVRSLVTEKASKNGNLRQVVPEIGKYKNKYDMLWEQDGARGYLHVAAILQKWLDQSGSFNTSYNPTHYPDSQIPMSLLLGDMLFAYKHGVKNLYYQNTFDGIVDDIEEAKPLEVIDEADYVCDSCVL